MRTPLSVALAAVLGAGAALLATAPLPAARAEPTAVSPPDFAAVAERARAGVVHLVVYLEHPREVPETAEAGSAGETVGSGFVWSPDGWILSSWHVTQGARLILAHVEGRGWMEAVQRGADRVADVALLKVEAQGLAALPIGNPRALRVGQWVLAAGSSEGLPRTFTHGIVSGLERSDTGANPGGYEDFIQTDAAVNVGGSGGPLLDVQGRVVGVETAIVARLFRGVSYAVPIDVAVQAAEVLRARGSVVRPTLGVRLRAAGPLQAVRLPGGAGLEVTEFADESPAQRAGLRRGDIVTAIDGVPTPTRGVLQRAVWSKARGATVVLHVWRAGQEFDVSCRLDES